MPTNGLNRSATKVVVTGLGATTPLGGTVSTSWDALLAGTSAAKTMEHEWAAQLNTQFAAEAAVDPSEVLERVKARRLDRGGQFALIAAHEAWADAGLDEGSADPTRVGVIMASGIGGIITLLDNYDKLITKGPRLVSPLSIPMLMPNGPAAAISLELNAKAGVHTPVSACASGNEAIAHGIEMIRSGRADVVIAGGTEACIHPLPMAAFGNMMALSKRNDDPAHASRPWDKGRDGFVMGEGSGALILESEEHARARGARIYAEAAGWGITSDAHDIAAPDAAGITRAIRFCVEDADISPTDIRHINAHATSTPAGDLTEAGAVRSALGDAAADQLVISGTKSMTGHLLGGAGAIEGVFSILSIVKRIAPPTINLDDPDDVNLQIATEPTELPSGDIVALNNSFGFGGHNVVVAFKNA